MNRAERCWALLENNLKANLDQINYDNAITDLTQCFEERCLREREPRDIRSKSTTSY